MTKIKKKVLITGTSSGIGLNIAKYLASKNFKVVGISRTVPKIKKNYSHVKFDLTDYKSYDDLFLRLNKKFGRFDNFLYSAGKQFVKPIKIIKISDIDSMIDINLKSAILFSKFLAHKKFFKLNSSAVFISSVMGVKGAKGQTIYSASKGGLISFVKSLAVELSSSNIRVNCISPGVIKSPMLDRYKKTINLESFNDVVNSHPIGIGSLSDVSNLINFLFSSDSKWITGQNIIIDGGFSS